MGKRKKNKNKRRPKGAPVSSGSAPEENLPLQGPTPAAPTGDSEGGGQGDVAQTEPGVILQPFGEGPRFSVLMAAYNRADLIHVAIESVLAQDFGDYELVIVDDGSTDDTGRIVTGYADPRIRYIRKDKNEGRSPTRNRAIAEARGEFVLWMADDDLLVPGLLTLYNQILMDNPGVDVVYGDLQLFDHDSGRDLNVFTPNDWTGKRREIIGSKLYGSCVPDGGTATRRRIYTLVGSGPYDDEFVRAQDYELWSRIVGQANFHKVDQIVYRYRKHSGGTSWGEFIDLTLDSKIIRRHLGRHPLRTLFPKLDWSAESVSASIVYLRIAKNLRIYGDHVNAIRFLDAVCGSESQPEAIEHRTRSLVALGDLSAASEVVSGIRKKLGRAHVVETTLRALVEAAVSFRAESKRSLEAGEHRALISACQTFGQLHEATYDSMLHRGLAHKALGEDEVAVNCLCLAARLNPDDEIAITEVRALVERLGFSPKTDIDAMRRRLGERFYALPSDTAPTPVSGPLVSVIVSAESEYRSRGLESVLAQTYQTMEILVPTGTPITDPRMVTLPPEGSIHSAGLARAQGEFIAWLDGADVWYPGHVSRCVGALQSGGDVAISHGHLNRSESGVVSESFWLPQSAFRRAGNLAAPILSLSFLVHRSAGRAWPVIAEAPWAFILELLSADRIETLPHPGVGTPLPDEADTEESTPCLNRARELSEVYGRYSRETLFDPAVRKAQNERLVPLGVYQVEMSRTSVVVLGGSEREEIEACLEHINKTTWVPYSVILVVTGISEATADWLNELCDADDSLRVQQCSENVSQAKAINEGLAKANGEFVAMIDVATRPSPGWLGRLQWWGRSEENFGALCPEIILEPLSAEQAADHRQAHWGQSQSRQTLDARCVVLRRDGLSRVGGMDVVLGAVGFEWEDFSLRMKIAGIRLGTARDVIVSSSEPSSRRGDLGLQRFIHRWGGSPEEMLGRELPQYEAERHLCTAGAEEGFRPDTRPVNVSEAKSRNLLVVPPWTDQAALTRLVESFSGEVSEDTGIWLRAPAGRGSESVRAFSDALMESGRSEENYPDVHIVDAHLAPEREGGLFVAADAVYVEEHWYTADETIRRAADCGRVILRGVDELTTWLTHG